METYRRYFKYNVPHGFHENDEVTKIAKLDSVGIHGFYCHASWQTNDNLFLGIYDKDKLLITQWHVPVRWHDYVLTDPDNAVCEQIVREGKNWDPKEIRKSYDRALAYVEGKWH